MWVVLLLLAAVVGGVLVHVGRRVVFALVVLLLLVHVVGSVCGVGLASGGACGSWACGALGGGRSVPRGWSVPSLSFVYVGSRRGLRAGGTPSSRG